MYSYSWDIAENGVSETLAEYKKMGINTVTLAASYHAGKFFRPKSKTNKIYFPEDGTVYFKHDDVKISVN
jgi:PKD repeat protein